MATPCKSCFLTVDNEVGKLAEVTAKLKDAGLNILAICAWTEGDTGRLLACTNDNEKACEVFKTFGECGWKEGICVEADNSPGALQAIAAKLAGAGINIDLVYATAADAPKARVVLHTSDNAKAAELV
jgi:hypothetical protein